MCTALILMMLFAGAVGSGCNRSLVAHSLDAREPAKGDDLSAVATVAVHGVAGDWVLTSLQTINLGNGGRLGSPELPRFEGHREGDHLVVECLLHSLCSVGLVHSDGARHGFQVIAGEPRVDVLMPEHPEASGEARPRYLEPRSRSAQVAALLEEERALVKACHATIEGTCGGARLLPDPRRVVPGHDPHAAIARLRAKLSTEDQTLATWAYFNAGCPESPEDAELARRALRETIDPLSRNLWPMGIARAILAAEGAPGAQSRLGAMSAPADRELAAALLLELINEARSRHELERAIVLWETLASGDGPWKGSPLRELSLAQRNVIGIGVGSIPLRTLTGERRDPADMVGAPILLYTAASWCAACHRDGLPELRSFAMRHPEITVLYVLWDDEETAASYVSTHAPIPGTIVLADDAAQAKLAVLLGVPSFPSFLVIDAKGRVVALPDDGDLDSAVRRSGVLEGG